MAEKPNSLIDVLKEGKTVICPNCKKAKVVPCNTTYDKAHGFYCENNCGFFVNYDPVIDID